MRWILTLVVVFAMPGAARTFAQDKAPQDLVGHVFLPDGKPAAGVAVSDTWEFVSGEMRAKAGFSFWSPEERLTDVNGVFRAKIRNTATSLVIIAIDSGRKLGATTLVKNEDYGKSIELRLEPLAAFRARIDMSALIAVPPFPPPTTAEGNPFSVQITSSLPRAWPGSGIRIAGDISSLALELPRGDYRLLLFGRNVYLEPPEITLRDAALDLGTIKPEMEKLARFIGKPPPPLTITEARGVPPRTKLSEYRGKVVVVEFWGIGCGICVAGSLPHLMRYVESNAAARDNLVILAFHDPSIGSLAMLDEHLPGLQDKHWKSRPLPFPILLDETGQTVKDWGIWGYPTSVVIDQKGEVVMVTHNQPDVERALDFLLARGSASAPPTSRNAK